MMAVMFDTCACFVEAFPQVRLQVRGATAMFAMFDLEALPLIGGMAAIVSACYAEALLK